MDKNIILDNIRTKLGIDSLNALQKQTLEAPKGNIILISATGSGKTLAFATRMLSKIKKAHEKVQCVVIAPSRELVTQIAGVVRPIATGFKTVALYGGHNMLDEKNSLTPCPDIIIATPGRLLDHMQRGNITIHNPSTLVLDEYDKSLELGFEGEMKRIVSRIGAPESIILTSATKLDQLPAYLGLTKYELIEAVDTANPRSRMDVIHVDSFQPDKLDTLTDLLRTFSPESRTIVFVNHRESAERVYKRLKEEKIDAALYHGALDQNQRGNAIELLANGSVPVLVATDLASRGLDIEQVDHVVHYHLPINEQTWTHRNGRTARVDAEGEIYVITSDNDNVPPYIIWDREYQPPHTPQAPMQSSFSTLYIDAGKKEKISRGDIVGFLIAHSGLNAGEIGRISLNDHNALVAVPRTKVTDILNAIKSQKLKGKKIRISPLKP